MKSNLKFYTNYMYLFILKSYFLVTLVITGDAQCVAAWSQGRCSDFIISVFFHSMKDWNSAVLM